MKRTCDRRALRKAVVWITLALVGLGACQTEQTRSPPSAPDTAPRILLPLTPMKAPMGCPAMGDANPTLKGRADD